MAQRLIDETFDALDEKTGSARPLPAAQHTGMRQPLAFWREPATWRPSHPPHHGGAGAADENHCEMTY